MVSIENLREMVNKSLARRSAPPVRNKEWRWLDQRGYLRDAEGHRDPAGFLSGQVLKIRAAFGPDSRVTYGGAIGPSLPLQDPFDETAYERAVAALLAEDAQSLDAVAAFRRSHIPSRQLDVEDVVHWVQYHLEEVLGGVLAGIDVIRPDMLEVEQTSRLEVNFRPTDDHNDDQVLSFPVPEESLPLRQLHNLSIELRTRFGWRLADATDFILANLTPATRSIRTRFLPPKQGAPLATSRLLLSVDPTSDPDDVAAAYRRARNRVTLGSRRYRDAPKTYALALFAPSRDQGEPWATAMIRWNFEHPETQYVSARQFQRDVAAARKRVLSPPLIDYWSDMGPQRVRADESLEAAASEGGDETQGGG